eukprot:910575-Pelagomonas_calceolata.AAC.1
MEELAVIAPEELFMDPTTTASSRGREGRGRGRGSGTRQQDAAPSQGGQGTAEPTNGGWRWGETKSQCIHARKNAE